MKTRQLFCSVISELERNAQKRVEKFSKVCLLMVYFFVAKCLKCHNWVRATGRGVLELQGVLHVF